MQVHEHSNSATLGTGHRPRPQQAAAIWNSALKTKPPTLVRLTHALPSQPSLVAMLRSSLRNFRRGPRARTPWTLGSPCRAFQWRHIHFHLGRLLQNPNGPSSLCLWRTTVPVTNKTCWNALHYITEYWAAKHASRVPSTKVTEMVCRGPGLPSPLCESAISP